VPVALAAVPLVLTRISEVKGPGGAVDLPGLVLVTAAALGLVWGLVRGNTAGWGSPEVIGTLAGGAAAVVAFAAWERRAARPMLPARLFRSPAFSAGNTAIFLINASLTGVIFLMPQFQQVVAGQDPLGSGLRLLPWGIAPFLVGPRAGALADRVGARVLVVTGALLQVAGVAWIAAAAGPGTSYLVLVTPMILIGAGLALAIPAATRSVTSTVLPADIGTASAAFAAMRQLGGAFGVAVIGAAFAVTGSYATPAAFTRGFTTAFAVAAGLALAGAAAGTILRGRGNGASATASPGAATAVSAIGQRQDGGEVAVGLSRGAAGGLLGVRAQGGSSAVDGEDGAVDEAGLVGQQVANGVGRLPWAAGPAEGVQGADLVFRADGRGTAAREERLIPPSGDGAEGDGVDADAPGSVVDGKSAGEPLDRGLRRRVREGAAYGPLRLVGGDVDDRAARPGDEEPPDRRGASSHREREIGHYQASYLRGRDRVQPSVPEHRGVVHPPGELARSLGQTRGTLGDVLVRGVPGQRGDAPVGRMRGRPADRRLVTVEHHDSVTVG
jgi:hypothetical protein